MRGAGLTAPGQSSPPAIEASAERGSIVRNLFCILVVIVWLMLMFPLACLVMLATWNSDNSIWVARKLFSPVVLWAGGAKLIVSGRQHAEPSRPTVYVSNHQSTSDIPVLLVALPVNVRTASMGSHRGPVFAPGGSHCHRSVQYAVSHCFAGCGSAKDPRRNEHCRLSRRNPFPRRPDPSFQERAVRAGTQGGRGDLSSDH